MCTPAVEIKNAFKAYSNDGSLILQNFNMTVQQGTIYNLLGASGCGKTTVLSSIVGTLKLDAGEINVFGEIPGTKASGIPGKTIGYMPQDIALYEKFTIGDIFSYFGRIYDMTREQVLSRRRFLLKFLDLPDSTSYIENLSGGQKRRTSLAVAMIHEPKLLILDEPTVGVDPLIRESIWNHLLHLVKTHQTTVILTTHYIEEARKADTVGLMKNGRLLVEKSPLLLIEEHETNLLHEIVLRLCKQDKAKQFNNANATFPSNETPIDSVLRSGNIIGLKYKSRSIDSETQPIQTLRKQINGDKTKQPLPLDKVQFNLQSHLNKIVSLVLRNFILLLRNPLLMIFALMLPSISIILINTVIGGIPKNISMGVVNKELLEDDAFLETCTRHINNDDDGCLEGNFSCTLINTFSGDFKWMSFPSEEKALESVQLGKSWGYVVIPSNFTEYMRDKAFTRNYIGNETILGSTVAVRMDMSDSMQSKILMEAFYANYFLFFKTIVTNCGADTRIVDQPLKYHAIHGSLEGGIAEYMQPAQILVVTFMLPMSAALWYVFDKKNGTMERTMVAGVKFIHYLIAMLISEGILIVLELTLCFATAIIFFNFTSKGSGILIFLISYLTGIVGLVIGLIVGSICSNELEIIIFVLGLAVFTIFLSGGIWPLIGLNPVVKLMCEICPPTLPIESFRSIAYRGWGLLHPKVLPGFLSLATWLSVLIVLNILVQRVKN